MFLRPTVFAFVLVIGTAAGATAQSDEYPFRRFRLRPTPQLRFSFDNSFRFQDRADRYRKLAVERAQKMADRIRDRDLAKWGREFTLRNRAFDRIDRAKLREFERKFRDLDRHKERFERFKFERPIRIKRHSRVI